MKGNAITPPLWFKKNAVYQINPRTFSREGTIDSITNEPGFVKETGFNIVYLCPVFEMDSSKNRNNRSERQLASYRISGFSVDKCILSGGNCNIEGEFLTLSPYLYVIGESMRYDN